MSDPAPDERPLLERLLEPFRSEAAAFRVLVWVAAAAVALIAVVLIVRAL